MLKNKVNIKKIVAMVAFMASVISTPTYAAVDSKEQMLQEIYDGVTSSETGSYRTKEKYAVDKFGPWTRALETRFYSARPADMAITGTQESGYEVIVSLPGASMEDVRQKDSAYEAEVARIVAMVDGKTADEKVRFFHDYIVDKCEYDYSYSRSRAYDCLIGGNSVCNGYAIAFYNLCDASKLQVKYIVGHASNGQDTVLHAWNAVNLDGEWKYFDLTWDDCSGKDKYYGLTEAQMNGDHTPEQVVSN